MAALASYAKQADDDSLLKMAQRIKARAIRRTGELLKQIEDNNRGRPSKEIKGGTSPNLTRTAAAQQVGLSPDQQKQAIRVANVPNTPTELRMSGQDGRKRCPLPLHRQSPSASGRRDSV